MLAAKHGRADSCEVLLQNVAKGSIVDAQRQTALHLACQFGNLPTVDVLLQGKWRLSPNARDSRAESPLHVVARRGHVQIASSLLVAGAVPNPRQYEGKSPLHVAVESGHSAMVALLVHSGADTALKDRIGNTALHYAALYAGLERQGGQGSRAEGTDDSVRDEAVDSPGPTDSDGASGTHGDSEEENADPAQVSAEMLASLVEGDADVRIQNSAGDTALHMACRLGIAPAVAELLNNAAVPDDTNFRGETALHACAASDAADCAELLLQHELDANIKNFQGRTALGEARMCGSARLERLLLAEFVEVVVSGSGEARLVKEDAEVATGQAQDGHSADGSRSARSSSTGHGQQALDQTYGSHDDGVQAAETRFGALRPATPAHEFKGIGARLSYAPDAASSLKRDDSVFGTSSRGTARPGALPGTDASVQQSTSHFGGPTSPGFESQLSIDEDTAHQVELASPSSTWGQSQRGFASSAEGPAGPITSAFD